MKRLAILLLLGASALAIHGCSGGGDQTGSVVATPAAQEQAATVTFSAVFPGNDAAVKSLLPEGLVGIFVSYNNLDDFTQGAVDLTPEEPSSTLQLVAGRYMFSAEVYDDQENYYEYVRSAGVLESGANTVLLTFLTGTWTFVGEGGNAAPIELSQGEVLDGFGLTQQFRGVGPVSFDRDAPAAENTYALIWGGRSDVTPDEPFSDQSRISGLRHHMQFAGGTVNNSSVESDDYNLTQDCNDWEDEYGEYMGCEGDLGDRFLLIVEAEDDLGELDPWRESGFQNPADDLLPEESASTDISDYQTSTVAGADSITGYLAEVVVQSFAAEMVEQQAPAARIAVPKSLSNTISGARKAAQSANTFLEDLTFTGYDGTRVWCRDMNADQEIDTGEWFLSEGEDLDGDDVDDVYDSYSIYDQNQDGTVDLGECTSGLALPDDGDAGEWNDDNENGVIEEWEIYDRNADRMIDYGDLYYQHYLQETEVFDVYLYPFSASGSAVPPPAGTLAIGDTSYVQYRTFENANSNRFHAWLEVTEDGGPIEDGDVVDGALLDPDDNELNIGEPSLSTLHFLSAEWDSNASAFGATIERWVTGYSISLAGQTLDAGTYSVELLSSADQQVSGSLEFPGQEELTPVASSSMEATWNGDGSLTLSWDEPAGTFGQYSVWLSDQFGPALFIARADPGVSSVTLPASLVDEITAFADPTFVYWQMQTRSYDTGVNYARSYSSTVTFNWTPTP